MSLRYSSEASLLNTGLGTTLKCYQELWTQWQIAHVNAALRMFECLSISSYRDCLLWAIEINSWNFSKLLQKLFR